MGFQPDVGRALAHERVSEAAQTGADIILSPCAGCVSTLEHAARPFGITIEDVVSPLARALGVEHENRLLRILAGADTDEILERAAGGLWENPEICDQVVCFVDSVVSRRTP
jgi:hypothetical protein